MKVCGSLVLTHVAARAYSVRLTHSARSSARTLLTESTETIRPQGLREIKLALITPNCNSYYATDSTTLAFPDPYWAFLWPGGWGLTRYVLDNPSVVKGRPVLDFASGSGVCAIAAKLGGASRVAANDIDPWATHAAELNADMNGVAIECIEDNMIGTDCSTEWPVVLVGDALYDEEMGDIVVPWLLHLATGGARVLIGDPGRCEFEWDGIVVCHGYVCEEEGGVLCHYDTVMYDGFHCVVRSDMCGVDNYTARDVDDAVDGYA